MALIYNHPDLPDSQLDSSVRAILTRVSLCSMATVCDKGQSHINTAFFAYNELLHLYFLSDPATLHCKNIAIRPFVGVTVFDSHQKWGESLQGLQLFGDAFVTEGNEQMTAERLYRQRFPAYSEWMDGLSATEKESLRSRFFVIQTNRLKILDEPRFGEERYISAEVQTA